MFCVDLIGCPSAIVPFKPPAAAPTVWTPSAMFSGYTSDGTNLTIPIASLNGLTASAAAASTGDARQVALSLVDSVFEYYNELTTRPTAMVVKDQGRRTQLSGNFQDYSKDTYQFVFYTVRPEGTVTDEPS